MSGGLPADLTGETLATSVTTDEERARAVCAVLWRIDNAGMTRSEARVVLETLGLTESPQQVRPLFTSARSKAAKKAAR